MSRRPGIARQYFDDHPDLYEHSFINISTPKGGKKFKPPRYYDRLFDLEHPGALDPIKAARKLAAENAMKSKMAKTNLSPLEILAVEENSFTNKTKRLRRKL